MPRTSARTRAPSQSARRFLPGCVWLLRRTQSHQSDPQPHPLGASTYGLPKKRSLQYSILPFTADRLLVAPVVNSRSFGSAIHLSNPLAARWSDFCKASAAPTAIQIERATLG